MESRQGQTRLDERRLRSVSSATAGTRLLLLRGLLPQLAHHDCQSLRGSRKGSEEASGQVPRDKKQAGECKSGPCSACSGHKHLGRDAGFDQSDAHAERLPVQPAVEQLADFKGRVQRCRGVHAVSGAGHG